MYVRLGQRVRFIILMWSMRMKRLRVSKMKVSDDKEKEVKAKNEDNLK